MHTGIQDRNNSLNRGDEVEYLHRAGQEGFTAFYAPEALVYHWVDPTQIRPDFFAEAGRGFGHSRVNMKDHFGPFTAARSSAGYLYLAGWHGLRQALAWSMGKTTEQYYHSYAKNIGLGGLEGSLLRLREEGLG
jgi:GT2 family glycosyltransferase